MGDGLVLLATSYFLKYDAKQVDKMRPFPPLATLYVAAALRERGDRVEVFDAMLSGGEHEFVDQLDRTSPSVVILYEDNFNFLSKMCLTRMREAALMMIGAATARGIPVVVAGSDVTDQPELYLAAGAVAAVVGEGDHTVAELADKLRSSRTSPCLGEVAGIVYLDDAGQVVRTARRGNERHPDVFPFPARDLIDIDAYRNEWSKKHGAFTLNMVSTRGCPFHCNWCAKPIWGQRYAMRSPANVAAEMAAVKRSIAPDEVWFADDIFGLREQWVVDFAAAVGDLDASMPFTIQSRCDLITEASARGLANAGCRLVWLGAESGSQRILDAMDKGITVDDIRRARRELGRVGVRVGYFVQFGYPGEEFADIERTIALVRETLPDDIGVSVSYPLPGTRFHSMVADDLDGETNWEQSGDLTMLFRGTYRTPFYKQLHLALHDDLVFRRRQAGLAAVDHPSLPTVGLAEQRDRVVDSWRRLDELERSSRNQRPTILVQSATRPAPDLSVSHNN